MRIVIAALLSAVLGFQISAQENSKGVIRGRIIQASSNAAVSNVQVTLVSGTPTNAASNALAQDLSSRIAALIESGQRAGVSQDTIISAVSNLQSQGGNQVTALSDPNGDFSFPNLEPGQYSVRVQREGYFGPVANGTASSLQTKTITLESGKTETADFSLVKGGVISGRVRNPSGNAQTNNYVAVGRVGYASNGRLIWLTAGSTLSDDQGGFRLYWLPPGDYYVGVSPRPSGTADSIQNQWANTFYPGVIDTSKAVRLHLKEGEELSDINMTLQLSPVGEFTLSGKILNLPASGAGTGGAALARPALDLMPHDLTPLDNPPVTQTTIVVASTVDASGNFTIQHVHPGVYDLYAHVLEGSGTQRLIRSGSLTIQVAGDQSGLILPLSVGAPLNGKVLMGGGTLSTPLNAIRLAFQPTERMPPSLVSRIGIITADKEGSFMAPSVPQGHYTITVSGLPAPGYVADIRYGGVRVFDDGIDIQSDSKPLEVIVSGAGITVQGSVHSADGAVAADAIVVLVPPESRRKNAALYARAKADAQGRFVIPGVAPGPYTAFAWDGNVIIGAWLNSDFLSKQVDQGKPVNVVPAEKSNLDLDLLPSDR
jgi:hypothetical protein